MRFGYCPDERDHERKAESDARYHHRDHDYYDRFTSDPCKEAYTEAYDREIRNQERREEERLELEAEERRYERQRQQQREIEEMQYDQQENPNVD